MMPNKLEKIKIIRCHTGVFRGRRIWNLWHNSLTNSGPDGLKTTAPVSLSEAVCVDDAGNRQFSGCAKFSVRKVRLDNGSQPFPEFRPAPGHRSRNPLYIRRLGGDPG